MPKRYRNHYNHCGEEWSDEWHSMSNNKCPECKGEIEPYQSDDLFEEEKENLQQELTKVLIEKANLTKLKAEDVRDVVLAFLEDRAQSAETLFDSDVDDDGQVMAFPMPWVSTV